MELPLWSLIPTLLLLGAFAIWVVWKSEEYEQRRAMRFREDLVSAILHSQPTWAQVVDMAETGRVPLSKVYLFCRLFLTEILTGSDPNKLKDHQALVESYVHEHRRTEPFEGLPNEVRIHLERLSDSLKGNGAQLEPLTHQIRELVAMHSAAQKKQRRYTSWGFFLGVLGFVFAGYAYFFPYSTPPASSSPTSHAPTTAK